MENKIYFMSFIKEHFKYPEVLLLTFIKSSPYVKNPNNWEEFYTYIVECENIPYVFNTFLDWDSCFQILGFSSREELNVIHKLWYKLSHRNNIYFKRDYIIAEINFEGD